jgi:hypothetical protein
VLSLPGLAAAAAEPWGAPWMAATTGHRHLSMAVSASCV